jgi:DNA polymerase-3 subunit alpha
MYHCHSDYSLLDSCTKFSDYIELAKRDGMVAIGSSEHGLPRGNIQKMIACQEAGLKFLYGVECYLTKSHLTKERDNYHTVLIAKNYAGMQEINLAMKTSTQEDHYYYVNRLDFDEFMRLSNNVIAISACIASPLSKLNIADPYYEKLLRRYDYLEIQHHDNPDQAAYNQHLYQLSLRTGKPLIAGTDTHNSTPYKAECRDLLMLAKGKSFPDEETFDLTYKTYDELVNAYEKQGALPREVYLRAIENTNVMAASVEEFTIDRSTKYPISYGSAEEDAVRYKQRTWDMLEDKLNRGIIPREQEQNFRSAIAEELQVLEKLNMCGFMLSMSELVTWCHDNDIPTGPARGSVGGSRVAYVTDIIDLNPETWHTMFSRFANADRIEAGD